MKLLSQELCLSISLDRQGYQQAAKYARAGFEAAECCLISHYHDPVDMRLQQEHIALVYDAIREGGLRIHSWHIPFGRYWDISSPCEALRLEAVRANAEVFRMLKGLEGEILVLHPSFEPIPEDERADHIRSCQKSLKELAPIAADCGKRIALENLPRSCLGRTSQEMELITRGGQLCGICMDTTHLFHETPEDFLDRCGASVIHTHLSDYLNGQDECHWLPGSGSLNWCAILDKLIALQYQGSYNFEVFGYKPLEIVSALKNALMRGDQGGTQPA